MIEYPDHQPLISELKRFSTKQELLASAEYRKHQNYLSDLLGTPQIFRQENLHPRINDFLRIAHWNIEKGKYLDDLISVFQNHPVLREADLISINEADVGMNRSGQRFVALELGQALQMSVAFAPCYLEFSKGYGDDLTMPGENTIALQGNAILSRYPIKNAKVIQLPLCYDHFEHAEKRIGNRNALAIEIEISNKNFCLVSTHLEVRNAPACRARQIATIISELEKPNCPEAAIIAGDFNSNTFARGGMLTTLRGFARMMCANPDRLRREIAQPQSREPLFALLEKHGFAEAEFNSREVTCYVPMKILEDSGKLPDFLRAAIAHQMARYRGQLDFRLDWIIGRKLRPLNHQEKTDSLSGISSLSPQTISGLQNRQGGQITDHDPITVDVQIW